MGNDWWDGEGEEPEMVTVDTGTMFVTVPKRQRPLVLCGARLDGRRGICKEPAPCEIHAPSE